MEIKSIYFTITISLYMMLLCFSKWFIWNYDALVRRCLF